MNQWNPAPPDAFKFDSDQADVWLIEVSDATDTQILAARLSPAEQARAARFMFEKDRRLFVTAHAGMRAILASYAGYDPLALNFVEGANGKPKFAPGSNRLEIEFNLSHSHQAALLAVAQRRELGVDIEYVKPGFAFAEVAGHFFTASEVGALRSLPEELQRQAFFKCWTSKEAFLKAKGTGLSGQLDEVEISLSSEARVKINANVAGWTLAELNPSGGYEAAIVIKGSALPIRCHRWDVQSAFA